MILVDTSVWVDHFRQGNARLVQFLNDNDVICHPMVIGELACGHIKDRKEVLNLLQALPMVQQVEDDEILQFIENRKLMGKGLGYIDMHLLASTVLDDIFFWTLDKPLRKVAQGLNIEVELK
ncbi:MAG: PIN domain-containing protein [Candidatus Omnitrophica bacterium]|nr:PIN domain-containing protein [Candidatus Omnitrophota bacterium]